MSRKREAVFMGIGILAGLALSGPAVYAATTITATLSNQPIYVNGQHAPMTAYSIGGNNYVRLRNIGQAVDFAVDSSLWKAFHKKDNEKKYKMKSHLRK